MYRILFIQFNITRYLNDPNSSHYLSQQCFNQKNASDIWNYMKTPSFVLVLPVLGFPDPISNNHRNSCIFTRIKVYQILSTTFIIKKGKNNICHPPDISKEIRTHCVQSSRDYFVNMLRTMTRISPRDATPRQWTKWTNQGAAYRCQLRFHCPPLANIQVYLSATHKRLNQSCNHHHTGWNPLSRVLSSPWHNPSYQLKDIENLVIFEFLLL